MSDATPPTGASTPGSTAAATEEQLARLAARIHAETDPDRAIDLLAETTALLQ